jgi:hypothetical protein
MTIKKASIKKSESELSSQDLVEREARHQGGRVITAGSPPPLTEATPVVEEKDIKFQMVISPELCRSIDEARKLSKTSRRSWLLQAAQEKLEREGKLLQK